MMTATKKRLLISCLFSLVPPSMARGQAVLFRDAFARPNGLIANDFATYHPGMPGTRDSAEWLVQSGSLFAVEQAAWTGVVDEKQPDAASRTGTRSAALRLVTRREDIRDAAVSFQLYNQGLTSSPALPARAHDGVHVWLRYKDEGNLYAVSVSRRDGTAMIQKKVGGTYFDLSEAVPLKARYRRWQRVTVAAKDGPDGSVTLQAFVAGKLVVSAVDDGIGGEPLRGAGRVGLRGDNCQFLFDDFMVTALDGRP